MVREENNLSKEEWLFRQQQQIDDYKNAHKKGNKTQWFLGMWRLSRYFNYNRYYVFLYFQQL